MTTKRKSRILNEVHASAKDLHDIGLISKKRMAEFDALCNLELKQILPIKIQRPREKNMSVKNL